MTKGLFIHLAIAMIIGGSLGALMGYFGKCSSGTCPLTANPFRGAVYGMVMGLLFAYSFGANALSGTAAEQGDAAAGSTALIHIDSQADFERVVLAASLPVLADFFSKSCPPCRKLGPTISELAGKYEGRAVVCKVNLDHAPELAGAHSIRGIPAVLFFVKGKEVDRIVGLRPKARFVKKLDELVGKETKQENHHASL